MLTAFTTRRWLGLGALLAIGFAIYGSLVPLHVRPLALNDGWAEFRALHYVPVAVASKTDLLTNFALFLPIGFLATGALAAGRPRTVCLIAVPVVVVVAAALSIGIEFAQVFIPSRTASLNDVVNETWGGIAGALAWVAVGPAVAKWMGGFASSTNSSSELARRLLTMYAAVWLVLGLLPFDLTLRPTELAEKFRQGRLHVVPFNGGLAAAGWVIGSTSLMAMPLGALAAFGWPRPRRAVAPAEGTVAAVGAIVAMEFCQIFVFTRTASVDDVLGGAIGAAIGARLARRADQPSVTTGVRLWPLAVLVLWLVVLVIRHWSPFNFEVTGHMFRSRAPGLLQVPFRSYYWANPFDALSEAITKVLLGLPVGVLLALSAPKPGRRTARWLQAALITAAGLGIFGAIELGQVFLPSRFPDGTDVLLSSVGTCLGGWGTRLTQAASTRPSDPSSAT